MSSLTQAFLEFIVTVMALLAWIVIQGLHSI